MKALLVAALFLNMNLALANPNTHKPQKKTTIQLSALSGSKEIIADLIQLFPNGKGTMADLGKHIEASLNPEAAAEYHEKIESSKGRAFQIKAVGNNGISFTVDNQTTIMTLLDLRSGKFQINDQTITLDTRSLKTTLDQIQSLFAKTEASLISLALPEANAFLGIGMMGWLLIGGVALLGMRMFNNKNNQTMADDCNKILGTSSSSCAATSMQLGAMKESSLPAMSFLFGETSGKQNYDQCRANLTAAMQQSCSGSSVSSAMCNYQGTMVSCQPTTIADAPRPVIRGAASDSATSTPKGEKLKPAPGKR